MGRYRARTPLSPAYVTPGGMQALQDELKSLWARRTGVVSALSAAAAEGDRSENAEYIYRKKELRSLDRRIGYLQKRIPALEVVSGPPTDPRRVFFGAWVTLEDSDSRFKTIRIVGSDETDVAKGWISLESPVARSLLSRTIDDEVTVDTPDGEVWYCIAEVSYRLPG